LIDQKLQFTYPEAFIKDSKLQGRPSAHKRYHPTLQNMKYFVGHFCPPGSGSRSETLIFSDLINFQYYIEVVPTVVDSYLGSKVSYQYSVKVWTKKMLFT
jgi:hypothetical protein